MSGRKKSVKTAIDFKLLKDYLREKGSIYCKITSIKSLFSKRKINAITWHGEYPHSACYRWCKTI